MAQDKETSEKIAEEESALMQKLPNTKKKLASI